MAGSDEAARARLPLAEDLAQLEQARADVKELLAEVDVVQSKIRKAHLCHVCQTKVREEE